MSYEPAWYQTPIDVAPAKSGRMRVRHRTLTGETPIVGWRQAVLRGVRPVKAMLKNPLRIHELVEDGRGVWMSDLPEELNQIHEAVHRARPRGRVLVGGLGLGILPAVLRSIADVAEIVVVECSKDVIALCRAPGYRVVRADLYRYLRDERTLFDCYMLDTWTGTGEIAWWREVLPLRRLIRRRQGLTPTIHCWAEDIMWGQVKKTLTRPEPHWFARGLPTGMTGARAERFKDEAGTPRWEKDHGRFLPLEFPTNRKKSGARVAAGVE